MIMLPARLVIATAQDIHAALREALDAEDVLRVDASKVASVDTAGAQLLLSLQHSAAVAGKPVEWQGASDALAQALAALGIDELFVAPAGGAPDHDAATKD